MYKKLNKSLFRSIFVMVLIISSSVRLEVVLYFASSHDIFPMIFLIILAWRQLGRSSKFFMNSILLELFENKIFSKIRRRIPFSFSNVKITRSIYPNYIFWQYFLLGQKSNLSSKSIIFLHFFSIYFCFYSIHKATFFSLFFSYMHI